MLTSSVLGGKNSNEKKVLPALMDSFILSTTFIVEGGPGDQEGRVRSYRLFNILCGSSSSPPPHTFRQLRG